jgi:hypothetical protein
MKFIIIIGIVILVILVLIILLRIHMSNYFDNKLKDMNNGFKDEKI